MQADGPGAAAAFPRGTRARGHGRNKISGRIRGKLLMALSTKTPGALLLTDPANKFRGWSVATCTL